MRRLPLYLATALMVTATACVTPVLAGDDSGAANSSIDLKNLPSNVDGEVRQAQSLRAEGKFDEAKRALAQLMLVAPDDVRVVGEYGKVMVQEGRGDDAVAFLKRAVELNSSDWTLYSALGVAYDEVGQAKNARLAYQSALSLRPGEPTVLNNIAMSRMVSGDLAGAHQAILQAQAAGSGDVKIAANVALVESRMPSHVAASTPIERAVSAAVTPSVVSSPATQHVPLPSPAAQNASAITVASLPAAKTVAPVASPAPGTPRVLGKDVVMQAIPNDPLAGPVAAKVGPSKRRVAQHPVAPPKPAEKAKTPSLRMSADAS